jgi:hypothetical protein
MFKKFNEYVDENFDELFDDIFEEIKPSPYAALSQAENKMREKIQDLKAKIDARSKPEQIPMMSAQYQLLVYQLKVLGAKKAVLAQKTRLSSNNNIIK